MAGADLENPQRTDERTPLLQSESTANPHEQAALIELEPEPRTKSWYAWRISWTVLGVFVLGVFIKGWIDADDVEFDLKGALKRALGGGLSGAAAMVLQVLTLMPLRTIMNYQYRHGTSFTTATGPVSRFGDTAANVGILALLQSNSYLNKLPTPIKTIFASACAAAFRMILTPIDTLKTTLQAQGARGTALLRQRIKTNGIGSLWWGAFATAAATFVGHYPWFATYNYLSAVLTEPPKHPLFWWLLRLAFIGFCASIVSDSISNSLRVVKTYRQVNDTQVSYSEAARLVVLQDGVSGLFGRGLKTRILANGLQGLLFSILWKLFLDLWDKKTVAAFQAGVENQLGFISSEFINWQGYVLAFSWGVWAFETYLIYRQFPNYSRSHPPTALKSHFTDEVFKKSQRYRQFPNYSRPHPPTALKSHFTDEVFRKSQRYGKDKARFSLVSKLYSQLLETGMITLGAFPWAWKISGSLLAKFGYGPEYEITHSIAFGTILFYLSTLPNLPVSIYSTFVLEEKHGFNKMTPQLFVADTLKGWAVGFVIGAPFMAAFLKIVDWAGQSFVPWLMTF
ncbi:unnamed protein product, partial [Rhizoctonia solani]